MFVRRPSDVKLRGPDHHVHVVICAVDHSVYFIVNIVTFLCKIYVGDILRYNEELELRRFQDCTYGTLDLPIWWLECVLNTQCSKEKLNSLVLKLRVPVQPIVVNYLAVQTGFTIDGKHE